MSLDITPDVPKGRQIVKAYGEGGFNVSGVAHDGSVLVFLERTQPWSGVLSVDALQAVIDHPTKPEILVIGCGSEFVLPDEALRQDLRAHGVVLEWMDTAAACRTYNVLAIEDRAVAAALVAVE